MKKPFEIRTKGRKWNGKDKKMIERKEVKRERKKERERERVGWSHRITNKSVIKVMARFMSHKL